MTLLPSLLRSVCAAGHVVFADGSANLIGQRSSARRAGELDDLVSVVRLVGGVWHETAWACSLDPGRAELRRLTNPHGVAILAPGQYRAAYEIGLHRNRPALRQVGRVRVLRDADRDEWLEPGAADGGVSGYVAEETGLFGIHVHSDAGLGAEASAGCTVLPRASMDQLLAELRQDVARWGPRFTYTVIEVA